MVYYGHQQNTGGKAYYFSGMTAINRNKERPKETDLNKPDQNTGEKPDQGNPREPVEKAPAVQEKVVVMENIAVKKTVPGDEQVQGVKMELTKY